MTELLIRRGRWSLKSLPPLDWLTRLPLIPTVVVVVVIGCAFLGDFIAPYRPEAIDLGAAELPPVFLGGDPEHLLGTDRLGRDIYSRLLLGARASVMVATSSIFFAALVGTSLGIISGYAGGFVDAFLMRVVDAMLALPAILVALLLAMTIGPSMLNVVLVIAMVLWARFARLIRAEVLIIKQREFIGYARVAGASPLAIVVRHIVPHVATPLVVLATLQLGSTMITEASLGFLGAGVPPPTPTWGSMMADGRAVLETSWWISVIPGIAMVLVVLSLNLLGDWLRDRLDPQRSLV